MPTISSSLFTLLALGPSITAATPFLPASVLTVPPEPLSGVSPYSFSINSSVFPYGLDGPKFGFYNETAFQWWYFDTISDDFTSSVVVQFFANLPSVDGPGVPFNAIEIDVVFPNGSDTSIALPATDFVITTNGAGSSGVLNGTGSSWNGSADLSHYIVVIDNPVVQANISIKSIAPPHVFCGPAVANGSYYSTLDMGWFNAIPDGEAEVELALDGVKLLNYTGSGYHDSNWGPVSFLTLLGTWYWGRGRLGPYSLVWADYLSPNDAEELVTGYAMMYGQIVQASCSGITVRPTGANSTYPPQIGQGPPTGFHIEFDLGAQGVLEVNLTTTRLASESLGYNRWLGIMTGGLKGGQQWNGTAVYEWLRNPLL